jgi:hypothetical protein
VLRGHRCEFSLTRSTLSLGASRPDGTRHDLRTDDAGHAYLPVDLPGLSTQGVWDTGAGVSVVDAGLVERHHRLFAPGPVSRGTDATAPSAASLLSAACDQRGGRVHLGGGP